MSEPGLDRLAVTTLSLFKINSLSITFYIGIYFCPNKFLVLSPESVACKYIEFAIPSSILITKLRSEPNMLRNFLARIYLDVVFAVQTSLSLRSCSVIF